MMSVLLMCFIGAHTITPPTFVPIKNVFDLERDAKALELYLQDQKDHKEFCPQIKWEQPSLSIYKEMLTSHLPKGCKK
jgi:hypothetical protein|tara:strand:+ start:28250 stop:28483 length:234 start_codon:yes stop_codon:yes gene_type:complete